MTLKYATTLQLAKSLKIKKDVPSWDIASTPYNELVSVGTVNSNIYYLDNKNILSGTYTIYSSGTTSIGSGSALTETTHYVLDKDYGKLTLTTAGSNAIGTVLTASYSYVSSDISDSELNDVISRSEKEVDNVLNTIFTDGSTSNPNYPIAEEIQPSKGIYDRVYFTHNKPLIDISALLVSDMGTASTTAQITTGSGTSFPSAGKIIIDNEIIEYTGGSVDTLHSLSRGIDDSTVAVHSATAGVHTTIVSASSTEQGNSTEYTPLKWDDDVYVTEDGKIYINASSIIANVAAENALHPMPDVENRFKIRYLYGHDRIPVDITRLTILYAKRMLQQDTVSKALFEGRNEFRPEMMDMDQKEVERIENYYRIFPLENT
jgi:hypothetical protein